MNILTHILSEIYGLKTGLTGKSIKSGYTDFPDICLGLNYLLEVSLTPEDAGRIYYNIPSKKYFDKLLETVGVWNGEWKDNTGNSIKGILTFSLATPEHILANIKYKKSDKEITENMEIKLFENYFHLVGFDDETMKHIKEEHLNIELEFFNDNLLIGMSKDHNGKAIFERNI